MVKKAIRKLPTYEQVEKTPKHERIKKWGWAVNRLDAETIALFPLRYCLENLTPEKGREFVEYCRVVGGPGDSRKKLAKVHAIRAAATRPATNTELERIRKRDEKILADLDKVNAVFAEIEKRKRERGELAGDGDTSIERTIIELHELTGMNAAELWESAPHEVDKFVQAGIRKRKAANKSDWLENSTKGWANEFDVSERTITGWFNKGFDFIKKVKHGRYRIDVKHPFIATEGWKKRQGRK